MRTAVTLVPCPLQTAFARLSTSLDTTRGTARALSSVFSSESDPSHHHPWRRQRRANPRQKDRSSTGPNRSIGSPLNRIILERSEVVRSAEGRLSATLKAIDSRTAHVRDVLQAEDGEAVRVGVVNAGQIDDASVIWRESIQPPEEAPPRDSRRRKKQREAASSWRDLVLDLGTRDRLLEPVPEDRRPKVALMLAVPRPSQLERLLPIISSLGVTTLVLCQASKVPKVNYGSHLLRVPNSMRHALIEGLSQSGETILPEVILARRLAVLLEGDLDRLFPRDRWVRAVAHTSRPSAHAECAGGEAMRGPGASVNAEGAGDVGVVPGAPEIAVQGLRFSQLEPPRGCDPADAGILVAVGPERGWTEPDELGLLQSFGFQVVTLGPRILRSDVAVSAVLTLAHAWRDDRAAERPSRSMQAPLAPLDQ